MKLCSRAMAVGGVLLLAGCAVTRPAPTEPSELSPVAAGPLAGFEEQQRERAQVMASQGRLADAMLAWEVLNVLRPDAAEYREQRAALQRQIDAAVADRQQRAAQAHKRGELDAASRQYLALLALQPDHAQAADALRASERERNRRSYLGKLSRFTLTRRAMTDAAMTPPEQSTSGVADRNELEHAALLAGQGDYDDAIAMLERRAATNRRDDAARLQLADVCYRKAESLAARDAAAARRLLERSVKLDPNHARAAARLKQLRANATAPTAQGEPAPADATR